MNKEKTYFGINCPELEASQDEKTKKLKIRIKDSQMSIPMNRLLSDKEMKRIVEDVFSIHDILNKEEKDLVDCDGREHDPNEIVYPGEAYLDDDKGGDPLEGRVFNGYKLSPIQKLLNIVIELIISILLLGVPVLLLIELMKILAR